MDAVRTADNRLVYIKQVATHGEELCIITYLSRHSLENNRSHCVPLLDSFPDDKDPNLSYIVMPFLRPVDNPPFGTVGDILTFTEELLEVRHPVLKFA